MKSNAFAACTKRIQSRVEAARQQSPASIEFRLGDAQNLPYSDQSMDLVSFFTVFSSILHAETRRTVARQGLRVMRPGGWLLWYDMRRSQTASTQSLELAEIQTLFPGLELRYLKKIHPAGGTRIARRSLLAFNLLEWILCWQVMLGEAKHLCLAWRDSSVAKNAPSE
jgi:ubiquinone/menaquinone biosynthesis C-methylase UbiE